MDEYVGGTKTRNRFADISNFEALVLSRNADGDR